MQKQNFPQSGMLTLRVLLACALVSMSTLLALVAFAANPTGGTINPGGPNLAWTGTAAGLPPTAGGEAECTEGTNCDSYKLTISGSPADWAAASKQVHIEINWLEPATDYDVFVHKGTLAGPLVGSSAAGGTTQEQVDLNPASASIGTGDFVVHVVYFASVGSADQYKGLAKPIAVAPGPIPATAPASGFAPRFETFNPPAAGLATLGRSSGEPSIGNGLPIAGHPEGRALFQSDVQTLRVTFNGSGKAVWENKPAATSQQDFDPILFTDRETGRTVVHLLTFAGNVIAGESSITETAPPYNDGDVYLPSKGSGIGSGIDHQTVGGGRYHSPLPSQKPVGEKNAVYYCSQALVDASCARSDDGGINYGASTLAYSSECGGLHGHVKVGPDGTVYLPNKGCGTSQAAVVSEDNGTTWSIRPVPGSVTANSDPAVAVDGGNKVYFAYAAGDSRAVVTTSTNQGKTWSQPVDVGAAIGVNNVVFPAMVAGDKDRAAFAFIGTPTAGGLQGRGFLGTWHLYVSTTYDGGATWATVDATPNDAVQRGCVWLQGGANVCRNMLDFMDVQIDQEGRTLVAYADGCTGGDCASAPPAATGNAYTALAAISRQSGGRRLLAKFDPPEAAAAPGKPQLNAKRNGSVVHLNWSEGDNGGSGITSYKILRGTATGAETLLTTVSGNLNAFDDASATDTNATYFYKVVAVNAQGESNNENEVSVRYTGDSLTPAGFIVSADPTGDQTGAPGNADLDIQSLAMSEPGSGPDAGKLVFKLKVADLSSAPNERMWRIIWNSQASPGSQYYVGMTKDQNGAVTYEYGTVATATVGLVLGVQSTTKVGVPDAGSFTSAGLITIVMSKNKIGNPTVGDVLGAMTARTFPAVANVVRSTAAADTNSNSVNNDNTANAAIYTIVGGRPTQLQNIATRLKVQGGDKVGIAGFIITGTDPKKVVIRGIAPSIKSVPGTMNDPVLQLFRGSELIGTNDDWKTSQQAEIEATGLAPTDDREAAGVVTLAPGLYTAILSGKGTDTGLAVVEVYDVSPVLASTLANVSTRGLVETGDNVLIGGVIIGPTGGGPLRVVARAIGPSLNGIVPGAVQDPTLEARDSNGALIASNDNFGSNSAADLSAIAAATLTPKDARESALIGALAPGLYTVIVRSKDQTVAAGGIGLVEVYSLGPQ